MSVADDLRRADVDHVLHAMAPADVEDILLLEEADGVWLTDVNGVTYLDANCGLMNVALGYGRRDLADVAAESMARLSYAKLFWGHGSTSAARLAARLSELTPPGIQRFFFTSSGSEATESMIKLVRYRNSVNGRPEKIKVIGREHSYHGMSLGAWSATGEASYWPNFGPRVPGFVHIPQPASDDAAAAEILAQAIKREDPATVAAFIAEPISLPAGIHVPHPDYWPRIREICTANDVLLVADEVVTGFGRTGRWFASEHWGLEPDLMILSKGITSGYLPLGAVAMTETFAAGLRSAGGPMLHGFTTGGHPVACDVALRTIQIIEDEGLLENAVTLGAYLRERLDEMGRATNSLGRVRGLGMLVAADLVADRDAERDFPPEAAVGTWVVGELKRRGTIMRAYADTMLLGLPLTATAADADEVVRRLAIAIQGIPAEWRE